MNWKAPSRANLLSKQGRWWKGHPLAFNIFQASLGDQCTKYGLGSVLTMGRVHPAWQNSERKYNRMRLYDDIVLYYISCQFQQQCWTLKFICGFQSQPEAKIIASVTTRMSFLFILICPFGCKRKNQQRMKEQVHDNLPISTSNNWEDQGIPTSFPYWATARQLIK